MNIFFLIIIILQVNAERKANNDGFEISGNDRHLTVRNDVFAYDGIGQLALATKQLPWQVPALIGFFP